MNSKQDDATSQPGEVRSSEGLGLEPERANLPPQIGRLLKPGMRFGQPVYSAEQMYAYAAAAVAAERERCAKLCEQEHSESEEHPEMALHCADRIRGLRA